MKIKFYKPYAKPVSLIEAFKSLGGKKCLIYLHTATILLWFNDCVKEKGKTKLIFVNLFIAELSAKVKIAQIGFDSEYNTYHFYDSVQKK